MKRVFCLYLIFALAFCALFGCGDELEVLDILDDITNEPIADNVDTPEIEPSTFDNTFGKHSVEFSDMKRYYNFGQYEIPTFEYATDPSTTLEAGWKLGQGGTAGIRVGRGSVSALTIPIWIPDPDPLKTLLFFRGKG